MKLKELLFPSLQVAGEVPVQWNTQEYKFSVSLGMGGRLGNKTFGLYLWERGGEIMAAFETHMQIHTQVVFLLTPEDVQFVTTIN